MKAITAKQLELLAYLRDYQDAHGFQPSMLEMQSHFGFKSLNTITSHLMGLEKKKLISRSGAKARAIVITEAGRTA